MNFNSFPYLLLFLPVVLLLVAIARKLPIIKVPRILYQFPALNSPTSPSANTVPHAMFLVSMCLIKKVDHTNAFSRTTDFSGYSDVAVASGLLLGVDIPSKFTAPLCSTSTTKFWTRWHIALAEFNHHPALLHPTAMNGMVHHHQEKQGFHLASKDKVAESTIWSLDLTSYQPRRHYIRILLPAYV